LLLYNHIKRVKRLILVVVALGLQNQHTSYRISIRSKFFLAFAIITYERRKRLT
jgi:hypothetical protein